MLKDAIRKLRAILDRVVASRALIDMPAMIEEAREYAATIDAGLKSSEGRRNAPRVMLLVAYLDKIGSQASSVEASALAGSALVQLDEIEQRLGAATADNPAEDMPAESETAPAAAAPARTQSRSSAPRKRAGAAPKKRAGGK